MFSWIPDAICNNLTWAYVSLRLNCLNYNLSLFDSTLCIPCGFIYNNNIAVTQILSSLPTAYYYTSKYYGTFNKYIYTYIHTMALSKSHLLRHLDFQIFHLVDNSKFLISLQLSRSLYHILLIFHAFKYLKEG